MKAHLHFFFSLSPKPLKPCRIGRRVNDSVLNVPVSKIVLNQPRIRALVGQGEAASMAEHMRMGGQGQPSQLPIMGAYPIF